MPLYRKQSFFEPDDEEAWTTLWCEVFGIDYEGIQEVAEIGKLLKCDSEELPVVRT